MLVNVKTQYVLILGRLKKKFENLKIVPSIMKHQSLNEWQIDVIKDEDDECIVKIKRKV